MYSKPGRHVVTSEWRKYTVDIDILGAASVCGVVEVGAVRVTSLSS